MEVTAVYRGGVKYEVAARGHRVVCDQPLENGGADEGMSPPEFLLSALAACAGYYAAQYLKARGLAAEDLNVRVTAEKGKHPARLAAFRIEVTAPGADARHQEGLHRAVKTCLIHNTLLHAPAIEIAVNEVLQEVPVG
ncbi:MAG TPA: OsmC family protein [Bryobacteraceae bacterium]|nr:OsmC family protein [Bryobacteraceae bacterium]